MDNSDMRLAALNLANNFLSRGELFTTSADLLALAERLYGFILFGSPPPQSGKE
jgi:thymidine kinase